MIPSPHHPRDSSSYGLSKHRDPQMQGAFSIALQKQKRRSVLWIVLAGSPFLIRSPAFHIWLSRSTIVLPNPARRIFLACVNWRPSRPWAITNCCPCVRVRRSCRTWLQSPLMPNGKAYTTRLSRCRRSLRDAPLLRATSNNSALAFLNGISKAGSRSRCKVPATIASYRHY